jgi:hypothetical protein
VKIWRLGRFKKSSVEKILGKNTKGTEIKNNLKLI